jgi:hypothetical protein
VTAVAEAPVAFASGVYEMSDAKYHADPVPGGSLSSTGARRLLPPSCPALYRHAADNPPEAKTTFDFGHAAHKLVLGAGADLVVVNADDWRTKAAREQQDLARFEGKTPILEGDMGVVTDMADAIRQKPLAAALFDPERGKPEQSLFWTDAETGICRRARLDWLPDPSDSGRMILADYKTSRSAEPAAFSKSCGSYGYHQQAAWYMDAVKALVLAEDVAFVFVVQEKTAPYLVTVCELDETALRIGRELNRRAIEVFAECQSANTWPGYLDNDVAHISLPHWLVQQHDLYL